MKKIVLMLAALLIVGCNQKAVIIIKDGKFEQTTALSRDGLSIRHMGLDALRVQFLTQFTGAVNFTDGGTVIIDMGRTDQAAGTTPAQYNSAVTTFLNSLTKYDDRKIYCVIRTPIYTPPCPNNITPQELSVLFALLIDA